MTDVQYRRLENAMPWLVGLGSIVLWQLVVVGFSIRQFVLPSPTEVFAALIQYREPIFASATYTLINTLLGFGIKKSSSACCWG